MSLAREYNSTNNQPIIQRLVEREVIYCVSCWVDDELSGDNEDWHECYSDAAAGKDTYCVNLPDGNDWEGNEDAREERLDALATLLDAGGLDGKELRDSTAEYDALTAADGQPPEVLEWWIITAWTAEQLQALGEVVMESPHGVWLWGRQCTGQAVYMDHCWGAIAEGMEILAGQRYSWDEKAGVSV
ncbi:hypothetical protein IIA79_02500 [bacterium]|nr:hypothetical protein [bacterium]